MKISVVICEPRHDDGVGAFEWHTDPRLAEKAWRELRGGAYDTSLWHNVTAPDSMMRAGEVVTDYVDSIYWDGDPVSAWGAPEKLHKAVMA